MLRRGGRACLAGWLGGLAPIPDFNPLLQMASGVYLTFFGSFVFGTPGFPLSDVPLQEIAQDVAAGRLKAKPSRVFRFEEIREAHRVMEANEAAERWSWSTTDTCTLGEEQMSKSVAIVTGASQGIGRATAIRLARDFSALSWSRETARIWTRPPRRGRRRGVLVIDADPVRAVAAQCVDRRFRVRPQIDLFDKRRTVGRRLRAEAARRAATDDRGVAGAEESQGFGGADVG